MRAFAYVDGLNLYHGLRAGEGDLLKYRWLDITLMCRNIAIDAGTALGAPVQIEGIKYCTSMVSDSPHDEDRICIFKRLESRIRN